MDYYDRIEEYLNDTLSESERLAFEEAMEQDAKLKQAVKDHEAAMDVVGSILETEIRDVIDNEELIVNNEELEIESGKLKVENGGAGVMRMNWMRWASAAAVVFVLGWWGIESYNYNKMEVMIYSQYLEKIEYVPERGTGNESLDEIVKILYHGNKFQESLDMIDEIPENQLSEEILKYKAYNLFRLKEFVKCVDFVESQSEDQVKSFEYLKILSLILLNKKSEAKQSFEKLEDDFKFRLKPLLN